MISGPATRLGEFRGPPVRPAGAVRGGMVALAAWPGPSASSGHP